MPDARRAHGAARGDNSATGASHARMLDTNLIKGNVADSQAPDAVEFNPIGWAVDDVDVFEAHAGQRHEIGHDADRAIVIATSFDGDMAKARCSAEAELRGKHGAGQQTDRKSTRLNSSHVRISYAV